MRCTTHAVSKKQRVDASNSIAERCCCRSAAPRRVADALRTTEISGCRGGRVSLTPLGVSGGNCHCGRGNRLIDGIRRRRTHTHMLRKVLGDAWGSQADRGLNTALPTVVGARPPWITGHIHPRQWWVAARTPNGCMNTLRPTTVSPGGNCHHGGRVTLWQFSRLRHGTLPVPSSSVFSSNPVAHTSTIRTVAWMRIVPVQVKPFFSSDNR